MKRGADLKKSVPQSSVDFVIAALGAGAAAPTVPVNGTAGPTVGTYPLRSNGISKVAAEIPTRTSAGFYVITMEHALPLIKFATAVVVAAGGSPTAQLSADVTKIDAANRTITVKCIIPNGTATDLTTSDMLLIYVDGQNSTA